MFLNPLKIEWDLTNGPLSKLVELLDTWVIGVRSVGPVGDFLDFFSLEIFLRHFICRWSCHLIECQKVGNFLLKQLLG